MKERGAQCLFDSQCEVHFLYLWRRKCAIVGQKKRCLEPCHWIMEWNFCIMKDLDGFFNLGARCYSIQKTGGPFRRHPRKSGPASPTQINNMAHHRGVPQDCGPTHTSAPTIYQVPSFLIRHSYIFKALQRILLHLKTPSNL